MAASDLLALFGHFLVLSLLAVGGAITTAPDMHRYLVVDQRWLSDAQFTASVALAQAAPGPNVLFVAVLGWNVAGALGAVGLYLLVGRSRAERFGLDYATRGRFLDDALAHPERIGGDTHLLGAAYQRPVHGA